MNQIQHVEYQMKNSPEDSRHQSEQIKKYVKLKDCPQHVMMMNIRKLIWNTLMEEKNMSKNKYKLPEIIVFAGSNGIGKTTITHMAKTNEFTLMQMILKNQIHVVIQNPQLKLKKLEN